MQGKKTPEPNNEPTDPKVDEVQLSHRFNYVGGHYAYKNSSKKAKRLDPENLTQLVLMTKPGRASRMQISIPKTDERAGIYPQHNTTVIESEDSNSFIKTLEMIPSRSIEAYSHLIDVKSLEQSGFNLKLCSLPAQRLDKIKAQFSHLSDFAFNQMLDIPSPNKRDFEVWFKSIEKSNQVLIAFPSKKTKQSIFVQVIQYDTEGRILGIKHCSFSSGEPLVINESIVDKFGNYRQIAHLGARDGSKNLNSVERFDDGTVSWIISSQNKTGAAALRPNGEIVFLDNQLNEAAELAARNLGADGVQDGSWSGKFDPNGCKPNSHAMQEAFKDKVRTQIGQIIDGAAIPGLDPIFWVEL